LFFPFPSLLIQCSQQSFLVLFRCLLLLLLRLSFCI
jgi:hypothetical protein